MPTNTSPPARSQRANAKPALPPLTPRRAAVKSRARLAPMRELPARRTGPRAATERSQLPAPAPAAKAPQRRRSALRRAQAPIAERLAALHRPGEPDYGLLLTVVALLLLGLVMVYSASQLQVAGDPGYYLRRQAIWMVIGGAALFATARIDYHVWRRFAVPGMLVCLALLLLTLKFGAPIYGAQRWVRLGFFSLQPSELTKLVLTVYIAEWLVQKGEAVRSLRNGLLPFATLTGVVLALVLLQNDLGTSLVIASFALAMFFAAGANVLQLVPTLALGALGAIGIAVGTPFRRARLDAFLHPLPPGCADAASYQVCQGLISLGSGGLFGRGLGDSVQKAGYLPNPFTDSIFAVIGEELGLLGCALTLALFGLLAFRALRIGRRAPDAFGALLACGLAIWLTAQALINVGSVVDAIPFTGVPLPFVSYGGSSLATAMAAVGVLLNISRHTRSAA